MRRSQELALTSIFIALGVVLSGLWFPVLGSKAYPFQHMINILSGIILGPIYAVVIAIIIGIIRNMLGIGTIYAFPGGIPGGLVVGGIYMILRDRIGRDRAWKISALTEPIGTVGFGAVISYFLVAPLIGDERTLQLASKNLFGGLLIFSTGWLLSSLIGVIIALTILYFLETSNYIKYIER